MLVFASFCGIDVHGVPRELGEDPAMWNGQDWPYGSTPDYEAGQKVPLYGETFVA